MSTKPILPSANDIIVPATSKLIELRPAAKTGLKKDGVYRNVFDGFRAQSALLLNRNAKAAAAMRLPFAEGQDLIELVDSEFETTVDTDPTAAVGECTLVRSAGTYPQGVIRKGLKFNRAANPVGDPVPVGAAEYVVTADVPVASGVTSVVVPLTASRTGSDSNHLYHGQATVLSASSTLFDTNFKASGPFRMSGGESGPNDKEIREYAKAYSVGKFGPTDGAIVAGCLQAGARHVAVASDPSTGILNVFPADTSWASSNAWRNSILQSLFDNKFVGFGCRLQMFEVGNVFIHVDLNVTLRDTSYLIDTTEIDTAIQAALTSYFNDRTDWFTWSAKSIKRIVSRAHDKILVCTNAVVKNSQTNATLTDPPQTILNSATHYYLVDNSVSVSYQSPT